MGLLPPRARISGSARLAGVDLLGRAGAALRGREVAMIFQDPMTSLTPHLRIGDQIAEPLVAHRGMSWRDARRRAAQLLDQVRMSDVPRRLRAVSARAVGRHAPARHDRHGAGLRSASC